jgi:hypothetical protein
VEEVNQKKALNIDVKGTIEEIESRAHQGLNV